MEKPNNYEFFDEKYKESVKFAMDSGNYFKDAFSWYTYAFIKPMVDRTILLFVFLLSIFVLFNLYKTIKSLLPVKENVYIVIREKDLSKYQTNIYDLSKNDEAKSTDEDVLRYLVLNYVKERENHNYKNGDVAEVNHKLEIIKNNSSPDVYSDFKRFMSRDNINGPYYFFGKDVESYAIINSFNFIRIKRNKMFDKVKDYFNVDLLPVEAEVYYTLNTRIGSKITSKKQKAIVSFVFSGIERDKKTGKFLPIKFNIIGYKNFDVK